MFRSPFQNSIHRVKLGLTFCVLLAALAGCKGSSITGLESAEPDTANGSAQVQQLQGGLQFDGYDFAISNMTAERVFVRQGTFPVTFAEAYRVTVTVTNRGFRTYSGNLGVELQRMNTEGGDRVLSTQNVVLGWSQTVRYTFTAPLLSIAVRARIDPANAVAELQEGNNERVIGTP